MRKMDMIATIETSTQATGSVEEWIEAVKAVIHKYGEQAIYYVDCDRFLKDGDEDVMALPYEEWKDGQRVHLGLEVQHSYRDEEGLMSTYSDTPIILW